MDRYGYVSNNYHGQAMAGQARATAGNGGCSCSSHHHHGTKHMPASQPMCTCNKKGPKKAPVVISQPPVMTQPGYEEAMIFSLEGRDWTTGICGCFEHCSSCMAAFCCPPCFACFLADHMNENMCGPLCMCAFCIPMRTRLRDVNDIQGSICRDMFACMFCPCCMFSQMYREIKNTME